MKHASSLSRRAFLRSSALTGGGLLISFSWIPALAAGAAGVAGLSADDATSIQLNGYLKIGSDGSITIMSPNPEGGQNVKTGMPMIVAEELDVDWHKVLIEQAGLNTKYYTRQFIGGSQAIRQSWLVLRMAGASARHLLRMAAAQAWNLPLEEITTFAGVLHHAPTGKSAHYGSMAAAAAKLDIPPDVKLKNKQDFTLIGSSQKNVDGLKIVTGQPLFGSDIQRKGMLIGMIVHPPAFGMKLKSIDDSAARKMPGIADVFPIQSMRDDFERQFFDTCSFPEVVAIVGKSTWEVMNAKKALKIVWEPFTEHHFKRSAFGSKQVVTVPAGLENTSQHQSRLETALRQPAKIVRKDGDPDLAFKQAAKVIERTFTAPFLAHNCMEPMNFFADVSGDKAELVGPLQKPELTEQTLSARLGIPIENIDIQMSRLGGGFGRRSYAHWLLEAALMSQKVKAPVKLIYTREDDMTAGIYRPAYIATYRAALDADNNLLAFHVKAGGIPESPLEANRFPAGAVEHYLAEEFTVNTNLTTGSFRAPRSNFIAAAEQAFLDEIAEACGKDPIDFRLALLDRAANKPVGRQNDYDPNRYAGVLELVREKSGWGQSTAGVHRGVSAYFCHNSYVAEVLDLIMEKGKPVVQRVCCAVDCGIVVNPDAAINLAEGSIVDGIGTALYGRLTVRDGRPEQQNFNAYRMIRHSEAPKSIDVHFVKNGIDPTGMGEPPYPPVFGALANALYKATGKRLYHQPFMNGEAGKPSRL
ncbi:molybdopterin cofactor-binding domain-containing protein [Flavihumibacter stibioxidans]|uniref:Isoquinoline 1-oxidoreductase n=1 Tax=Flavihumibacter stibioxidans TaxID=1834163 RepID=A0ABR7M9B1_9BACT|nr:molybdopterin cofactor-binding domain-containing protein [Flavihumibacter stibioxidans]MBC6491320.1 isoquinoline 1-oxidoreductase [Flavihumibacter stibioxidans]